MTRFYLKYAFVLTLIFAVLSLLIRAQPYDDSELRAFLILPDGCPAPCFMGIRPGVTTVDEAIAILEGHEWVAEITNGDCYNYDSQSSDRACNMTWIWSGRQPAWIDQTQKANLSISPRNTSRSFLTLRTTFPLGTLLLALGSPDLQAAGLDLRALIYGAIYVDTGILIGADDPCPGHNLLKQPTYIQIHAQGYAFTHNMSWSEILKRCNSPQ